MPENDKDRQPRFRFRRASTDSAQTSFRERRKVRRLHPILDLLATAFVVLVIPVLFGKLARLIWPLVSATVLGDWMVGVVAVGALALLYVTSVEIGKSVLVQVRQFINFRRQ